MAAMRSPSSPRDGGVVLALNGRGVMPLVGQLGRATDTRGAPASIAAMRCPYCTINMHPVSTGMMRGRQQMFYDDTNGGHHTVEAVACPECKGVFLTHSDMTFSDGPEPGTATSTDSNIFVLLPRVSSRGPAPESVPKSYADLYSEAALILTDSSRASAAMSRRCLQQLLRDEAHAPHGTLHSEIEWALKNANLPPYATESLHDLRDIGNFAAHPNKSTATGDYLEVQPGEADWTLDTLDALFGHYFVGPAKTAARKAALTERLSG